MTPRALFLDTSGTLYRCPALDQQLADAPVRFLCKKRGISVADAKALLRQAMSEMRAEGTAATKSGAIQRLGHSNADFQACIARIPTDRYLSPNEADLAALEALSERYILGIITNIGRAFLAKVLHSLQVNPALFRCVVTSDDVAEPKPHTEPFQAALKQIGLAPEWCAYVGDDVQKDLVPANSVGLRTILIAGPDKDHEDEFFEIVANLTDLVELLNERL